MVGPVPHGLISGDVVVKLARPSLRVLSCASACRGALLGILRRPCSIFCRGVLVRSWLAGLAIRPRSAWRPCARGSTESPPRAATSMPVTASCGAARRGSTIGPAVAPSPCLVNVEPCGSPPPLARLAFSFHAGRRRRAEGLRARARAVLLYSAVPAHSKVTELRRQDPALMGFRRRSHCAEIVPIL